MQCKHTFHTTALFNLHYLCCEWLDAVVQEHNVRASIYGPGDLKQNRAYSRACPAIAETGMMLRPEYERKTWELKALHKPAYQRVLWITPRLSDSLRNSITGVGVERLPGNSGCPDIYMMEGQNFMPMTTYKTSMFVRVAY